MHATTGINRDLAKHIRATSRRNEKQADDSRIVRLFIHLHGCDGKQGNERETGGGMLKRKEEDIERKAKNPRINTEREVRRARGAEAKSLRTQSALWLLHSTQSPPLSPPHRVPETILILRTGPEDVHFMLNNPRLLFLPWDTWCGEARSHPGLVSSLVRTHWPCWVGGKYVEQWNVIRKFVKKQARTREIYEWRSQDYGM